MTQEIARRLVDGEWVTDVEAQGGGGGGSQPWGEAIQAAFVGSGNPIGKVTPNGIGDLYVDSQYGALWLAIGATDADWREIASGETGTTLTGSISANAGGGSPSFGAESDLRLDCDGNSNTAIGNNQSVTTMPLTVTSGAGNGINTQLIAPRFAAGSISFNAAIVVVSNALGTDKLCLLQTPPDLTSAENRTIDWRSATVLEQVGVDLAINATNGHTIDSTAGGQYSVMFYVDITATGLARY